jgi:hypothetical protein
MPCGRSQDDIKIFINKQEVLGRTNMPTFPTKAYSRQYSMSSPPYKISPNSTNRFKSCAHLTTLTSAILKWLKLRNLIVWNQGRLQCHQIHTKFHPKFKIYFFLHPPQTYKRLPF